MRNDHCRLQSIQWFFTVAALITQHVFLLPPPVLGSILADKKKAPLFCPRLLCFQVKIKKAQSYVKNSEYTAEQLHSTS